EPGSNDFLRRSRAAAQPGQALEFLAVGQEPRQRTDPDISRNVQRRDLRGIQPAAHVRRFSEMELLNSQQRARRHGRRAPYQYFPETFLMQRPKNRVNLALTSMLVALSLCSANAAEKTQLPTGVVAGDMDLSPFYRWDEPLPDKPGSLLREEALPRQHD